MSRKRKLLAMTALPLAASFALAGSHAADARVPVLTAAAQAPSNPCAAANPCAPAAVNPCAARPAIVGAGANPYDLAAGHTQAPYGDAMPAIVKNYLRAAPYVGTGGLIEPDAFAELKALGFKTVINLNTEEEGAAAENEVAVQAGLAYVGIPVTAKAPSLKQVEEFSSYVNDPAHYPILVHCVSSNRVGATWAIYRTLNGVPPEIAIQEGRTVGLKPSREKAVRQLLKLPPLSR